MYYEENITLSPDFFDGKGNVLPFYILAIFERVATYHGEKIGVGEEKMREKNLYWIISQSKYKVLGRLTCDKAYRVKTWPLKPNGIGFQREYLISELTGEPVVMGSSNWLTIDRTERKLKIGQKIFPEMEFLEELNFGKKLPRLRDFPDSVKMLDIVPKKEHTDSNGHVNNKHYTTFILNAIKEYKGEIDTFQIDYIAEIMPGQKLSIFASEKDGETLVKGETGEKRNFIAKIEYKA